MDQALYQNHLGILREELLVALGCTDVDNLYIVVELEGGGHSAEIEIQEHHNNITYMKKDGTVLLDSRPDPSCKKQSGGPDRMLLNVANILEFADTVKMEDVEELIARQIDYNTAISDEGLKGNYGVETGRILMENAGSIISRSELMDELWQTDAFVDDNTLTVNVNRLRRSLESAGVPDDFITTRRDLGYMVR